MMCGESKATKRRFTTFYKNLLPGYQSTDQYVNDIYSKTTVTLFISSSFQELFRFTLCSAEVGNCTTTKCLKSKDLNKPLALVMLLCKPQTVAFKKLVYFIVHILMATVIWWIRNVDLTWLFR